MYILYLYIFIGIGIGVSCVVVVAICCVIILRRRYIYMRFPSIFKFKVKYILYSKICIQTDHQRKQIFERLFTKFSIRSWKLYYQNIYNCFLTIKSTVAFYTVNTGYLHLNGKLLILFFFGSIIYITYV